MNSGKNLQYNFPKTRGGGGSKAIWNFSEKTSVLVGPSVPYPIQIYISKKILSPTLCPKGTQKLSNFVYIWHIHMTEGTNLWKRWRIVCLSVITPTFPLKTLLNHFQCFTDPHNLTYYESSRHVLSTDIGDLCWVTKLYFFGISSFLSNTSSSTLSSVSTTSSFLSSPSPPPLGLKYRDSPIEQKAICWLNVEMGWTVRVASQVPVHLNNQDPSQ